MSVISEAYIMRRLREFVQFDAGKAKIAQVRKDLAEQIGSAAGTLSEDKAQKILRAICKEFKQVVRKEIKSFRADAIHANIEGYDDNGFLRAGISVDDDALRRASLHHMNSNLSISHGEGVNDILALFAHGYELSKRPYGFWVHDGGNSMTWIGARMHRDPNPFLANFVSEANAKYAGQCTVTLKDDYR